MIARREDLIGGRARSDGDRCPYPRPFVAGFAGCPAFKLEPFLVADAQSRPIGKSVTCHHLTVGDGGHLPRGQYYARCALGDAAARARWVAMVGPAQLEIVRSVEEEFAEFSLPYREKLFAAKALVLANPESTELRQRLERLTRGFLDEVNHFLGDREVRMEDVGLPVAALMPLIEEWSWAWTRSRDHARPAPDQRGLQAFAPAVQALIGRATAEPWRDDTAEWSESDWQQVGTLRIVRSLDPPGLTLCGDIDASTVEALDEALDSAIPGSWDVHVDMSGVLFCDLGGLRTLVKTAERLERGRRLVIRGASEQVRRAMAIAEWAQLPYLVVEAGTVR